MLNSRMAILALAVAVAVSAHAVAEDSAQETLPSTMGEEGVAGLPDEGTPSVRDPNELDRDPNIKVHDYAAEDGENLESSEVSAARTEKEEADARLEKLLMEVELI